MLEAVGASCAHVVGYSMGGWAAVAMAMYQQVLSLIVGGHAPGVGTSEEDGLQPGVLAQFDATMAHPSAVPFVQTYIAAGGCLQALEACFNQLEDVEGMEQALADAGLPVLLFVGKEDQIICAKNRMLSDKHNWGLCVVEGDHVGALRSAEGVALAVQFIQSHSLHERSFSCMELPTTSFTIQR